MKPGAETPMLVTLAHLRALSAFQAFIKEEEGSGTSIETRILRLQKRFFEDTSTTAAPAKKAKKSKAASSTATAPAICAIDDLFS